VLACLRFAQNPNDRIAGFRTLQLIPGIGAATAEMVLQAMPGAPEPVEGLRAAAVPSRAAADWPVFVALYARLRADAWPWPAQLEAVRAWYEPHLDRLHEDFVVRRADLLQLEQTAAGYPSRERFLTEITLDPPSATSDLAGAPHRDDDYLVLSTIHSAKGQEWRQVFMLNCVDGCIPSDLGTGSHAEIEEERRLLYVGMTRAKDTLHLMQPLRFFTHGQHAFGDRHVHAGRTRFIPDAILHWFDQVTWPSSSSTGERATRATSPRIDVKQRMLGLWS
jgi:DNA helicase-2/ATP-dependent DNA helicase PcrA